MKKTKNNKKLYVVTCLSLATVLGGTLAYFNTNSSIVNTFKTALYQNEIIEKFESPITWTPGTTTEKTVKVTNTGNTDMALRATFTEKWVNSNGEELSLKDEENNMAKHYADLKTALLTRLSQACPVEYRLNEIKGLPTVNNIVNISFRGINAEGLVSLLDCDGFMVSQGSACHSGSLEPSKVLKEIGVSDDYIHGTIRISFGLGNTYTEIYQFIELG